MIITRIYGGLGNQLFQYAIGRSLAVFYKTNLVLDLGMFKKYSLRNFELDNFNIQGAIEDEKYINLYNSFERDLFNKIYNKIFNKKKVLYEANDSFNTTIFEKRIINTLYLVGYWQNAKYFEGIKNIIKQDLTLKNKLPNNLIALEKNIYNDTLSVSLHIRKTDFVTEKKNTSIFSSCGVDYYQRAEEYLLGKFTKDFKIKFYVFSDDFDWVRQNLKLKSTCVYMDSNNKPHEDLYLMSICKHNITANSTFSWWGAWLNANPEKIVITPSKWFVNNKSDKDLVPDSWVRIKN